MSKAGLGETVGRGKRGKLVEDPKHGCQKRVLTRKIGRFTS
jgi:hypothetical protein